MPLGSLQLNTVDAIPRSRAKKRQLGSPIDDQENLLPETQDTYHQRPVKVPKDRSRSPTKLCEPSLMFRRNERERNRVKLLNLGFDRLRAVVPSKPDEHMSKITTLKKAIWYIEHLDKVLHEQDPQGRIPDSACDENRGARIPRKKSSAHVRIGVAQSRSNVGEVSCSSDASLMKPGEEQKDVCRESRTPSPIFPTFWDAVVSSELTSTPQLQGESSTPVRWAAGEGSEQSILNTPSDSSQQDKTGVPEVWSPTIHRLMTTGGLPIPANPVPQYPWPSTSVEFKNAIPQLQWLLAYHDHRTDK